jgi:hypothetical protein
MVQPVKGAAKDGVIGFSKGVGKGALQTLTKPAAGKSSSRSILDSAHICLKQP